MSIEFYAKLLTRPTVFVLGAGASKEYGFPLGNHLKDQMVLWGARPEIQNQLTRLGFDKTLLADFREALHRTKHPTIDIFLEYKPSFRDIGAHLIAQTLIPKEAEGSLFPQRDWYAHLFDGLDFENDGPNARNLAIVTLNYDRSLEHFLRRNIDYNCRESRSQFAKEKLSQIRIVHAHGALGVYPDVAYGKGDPDDDTVHKAATQIKIVSDRLEDSADFQDAQKTIAWAERIVFLGFGYHRQTLASLLKTSDSKGQTVLGTSHGALPDKQLLGNRPALFADTIMDLLQKTVLEPSH